MALNRKLEQMEIAVSFTLQSHRVDKSLKQVDMLAMHFRFDSLVDTDFQVFHTFLQLWTSVLVQPTNRLPLLVP